MQRNPARLVTVGMGILLCLSPLPPCLRQVRAQSLPPSSTSRAESASAGGLLGTEASFPPDLCERLERKQSLILHDVSLDPGRNADLVLRRFSWPERRTTLAINGVPRPAEDLAGRLRLTLWRGSVAGEPQSEVFLALSPRGSRGWVRIGSETFPLVAEPSAAGGWEEPRTLWVNQDTPSAGSSLPRALCHTATTPRGRPTSGEALPPPIPLPLLQARVAIETDWQFYSVFNDVDAATTYVLQLLGAASLRFWEQAGIVLVPAYVGIYTSPADPWATPDGPCAGGGTYSLSLLNEFTLAWGQGGAPVAAEVYQFLDSACADGGIANLASLCDPSLAFSVATGITGTTPFPIQVGPLNGDFYLVAHEIGHVFNAIHTQDYCPPLDECAPPSFFGPCQTQQVCVSNGTIMSLCHLCPGGQNNITTYFHTQSAADIRAFADASCLGPLDGPTARVSVDSTGVPGNDNSWYPLSISGDGRFVVFYSDASNLVPGDGNGYPDVFLHDTQSAATTLISVDSSGIQGNNASDYPVISRDGTIVVFYSAASNLVPGDTNGAPDIFVRDLQAGTTSRASVDSGGLEANNGSAFPATSRDGRYVTFTSGASNLVPGDTNGVLDIFVRDRQTGATTRASVDSGGVEGNRDSAWSGISDDGRIVAFTSDATNLVPGDTNGASDVFVRDRQTGTTTRVSVDSGGAQSDDASTFELFLSGDGRFVAFTSLASNLVPGDTNGFWDVFVHDRLTLKTERVSVDSSGGEGNNDSAVFSMSSDGRWVAFYSFASNLVPEDTNGSSDVFIRDRLAGTTTRASVDSSGVEGNDESFWPSVSDGGRFIAFTSLATNLVPSDTNAAYDVFVHERVLPPGAGQWSMLSGGTGGSLGQPVLAASGTIQAASPVSFTLLNAQPSAPAVFVLSPAWSAIPLGGGTLWPAFLFGVPITTDSSGSATLPATLPPSLPPMIPVYAQFLVYDPTAQSGGIYTLTNGVWGISQ